jgi:hypothetical protein
LPCPAITENYRSDFSSKRAPHINKPVNCLKIIRERRGKRWDGGMWTGLVWLRIGTGGELL